ncbi:hypothetical protein D3C87_1967490 [compost metagenome]
MLRIDLFVMLNGVRGSGERCVMPPVRVSMMFNPPSVPTQTSSRLCAATEKIILLLIEWLFPG